jgi:protocatechuate 3,4-dioxygenase beta subunit
MKRKTFLAALPVLAFFKGIGIKSLHFLTQSCKTQKDQEGPFYKSGSPLRASIETEGTLLTIQGKILAASDCKTPVADATVDIWHCDAKGDYDNEGFKCRGMVISDKTGTYSFTTIYPPPYASRPRHIHFKVRAKGFPELTSQIYFKGDPNIKNDFARNAESSRVIELKPKDESLRGKFDIYI